MNTLNVQEQNMKSITEHDLDVVICIEFHASRLYLHILGFVHAFILQYLCLCEI